MIRRRRSTIRRRSYSSSSSSSSPPPSSSPYSSCSPYFFLSSFNPTTASSDSSTFGYSSGSVAAGDTVLGVGSSSPSTPATSTNTYTFFTGSLSPFESSAPVTAPSNTTTAKPTSTDIPTNSSSSVSTNSTLTAATSSSLPQSIVSVPDIDPAICSPERNEVAAILASQCEKLLSCQAARRAQQQVFGATWSETPSSSKPVNDDTLTPAATAEQKHGESKPCSVPMTSTPSTSTHSAPLDSKSGSSVLRSSQAAEEQPSCSSVDLLHSTIGMWERVVADKKTNQEVTEEGLRHFYEGINYFCLQSERLQVATAKYNEAAKASDDLENAMASLKDKLAEADRKLEDSQKEKERLGHELAGAANTITALTGEKESLLRVQTILHQKIVELEKELEEVGPAAIRKYKASSLYRQELMEYAAPYMGKGVKLAIEKIKAKDTTFDPKTYGLEIYMLPPEADVDEFSSEEEGDDGAEQEHNEVNPSARARDLAEGASL
ncbi:PREDICTED: flocculation protein FLO11-like [Nicotiana attenuata]|uniref:flocculation protein FLO11-like n=1 Tax=Nicotiana attenuata TaxID=49451 RepID=UPI0009053657|nr:PREDICTED: flocculation protein FLO11-like [Nicotiana attenuata]